MHDFVPETFARSWVSAWNQGDVDSVLANFADDVVFVSPLAATVTGNAEVSGKTALRAYWAKALGLRSTRLEFQLDFFTWDEKNRALLIVYLSTDSGRRVRKAELMHSGPDGLIHRGEAFSGAAIQ